MASREFLRMEVRRGAAMVQIAVTRPVVIKTTRTHPGTSPLSEEIGVRNLLLKALAFGLLIRYSRTDR
jgi:hypothetical protein